MTRRVVADQKQKALTTLAIDTLINAGLRTQCIASELHVSLSRCKTLRQQASERGNDFECSGGSRPSPRSVLKDHLHTIEHTVLLGVYNASIGCQSLSTKDAHLEVVPPPLFTPALYNRFLRQIDNLAPMLQPLYLAHPKHKRLDISGAWMLLNDYQDSRSWVEPCVKCKAPFAIHQDQDMKTSCPFCALAEEWSVD